MAPSSVSNSSIPVPIASVFQMGNFRVRSFQVAAANDAPPRDVYIDTPETEGTYPVILFLSGFLQRGNSYSQLLQHISSHGFIIVAPQVWQGLDLIGGQEEVDLAARITNWLKEGLKPTLPQDVEPDLGNLNLVGHSRGGKAAFALALGCAEVSLDLPFSKLLGIDPVAGALVGGEIEPKILTDVPNSFNLAIPVTVIGTGLGSQWNLFLPPCAPKGMSHEKFFKECKAPSYHLVTEDYGHMDMLDDGVISSCLCKQGEGPKDPMRRCVGGIVVAFLSMGKEDLMYILNHPDVAPVKLKVAGVKEDEKSELHGNIRSLVSSKL